MRKFEYKNFALWFGIDDFNTDLNNLGDSGWEVYHVIAVKDWPTMKEGLQFFMKREILPL
jgi:hypothetical protein